MKQQFISSREIAQRLAQAGQAQNQMQNAKRKLARFVRQWNRQNIKRASA